MATLSPTSNLQKVPTNPNRAPPPSLFLGPPSRNASNISLSPPVSVPSNPSSPPIRAPLARNRSARGPESIALGRSTRQQQQQSEGDRTDALWAEMQATLAEVELSAANGTHVFGQAHEKALEELRVAQVELAMAWGREEDEVLDDEEQKGEEGEDDGEADVRAARKRREANERYFKRVEEGVGYVVGKLETVAGAMGKVERETREIWNGSESGEVGSGSS